MRGVEDYLEEIKRLEETFERRPVERTVPNGTAVIDVEQQSCQVELSPSFVTGPRVTTLEHGVQEPIETARPGRFGTGLQRSRSRSWGCGSGC